MLLVDDLAAGGTKNLRHTPRGLVTLKYFFIFNFLWNFKLRLLNRYNACLSLMNPTLIPNQNLRLHRECDQES